MKKYILALLSTVFLNASVNINNVNLKITYESVELPKGETMGLAGVSQLYDIGKNLYLGGGIYGTLDGKRGGFFTGGIDGGYKTNLTDRFWLDTGVFVGGGGGGAAPQGGGLMLRPYIDILYDTGSFKSGLSLSKVKFPNGDIDSNQVAFTIEHSYQQLFITNPFSSESINHTLKLYDKHINFKNEYYGLTVQSYHPNKGKDLGGNPTQDIKLIGFEYSKELKQNLYGLFQTAGANDGGADGYAEVLFGLRYLKPLSNDLDLEFRTSLGSAGGGKVDTGGGAVYKVGAGLNYNTKNFYLNLLGGYFGSDGSFKAEYAKAGVGFRDHFASFGDGFIRYDNKTGYNGWDFMIVNQTYQENNLMRKSKKLSGDLQLMGFKFDRSITQDFYISAQAMGAYKGDAGGYAVGLVGIGYKKEFEKLSFVTEVLGGAGGGGGIATGDALIYQVQAGLGYKLSENFDIELTKGKVKAKNGTLNSDTLEVGVRYRFFTIR